MGSFRAIIAGPPSDVDEIMSGIREEFNESGFIKNTIEFEPIPIEMVSKKVKDEYTFEEHPYLNEFSHIKLLNWLSSLEGKGHDEITDRVMWFVCYRSPVNILDSNISDTILYKIKKGSTKSATPFSHDPSQDYKTEM